MNYPDWQREIRLAQAKRNGKPEPDCFDPINVVIFRSILYQLGIKAEVNEIFARNLRPGWTSVGNAIDGLDIFTSLGNLINQGA